MKSANYKTLSGDARSIAHLAALARVNTITGGASALVIAEKLNRMGSRIDPVSIVSDVYASSTGRHHANHEAWECPECGCAHLGQEAALQCCQPGEDFEEGAL